MESGFLPQAASSALDANPLVMVSSSDRDRALCTIAAALWQNNTVLLEANTLDLEAFQLRWGEHPGRVDTVPLDWFRLRKEQIKRWVSAFEQMANLPDPLRQMAGFYSPRQCYWMSMGTVGLAYEGVPEVAALAIGMSLKTGNRLVLRSSEDSIYTHRALVQICHDALETCDLPMNCIMDEAGLKWNPEVKLWIAYGRPEWRSQVRQGASGTVLESAIGNCYLYWAASGGLDCVREMILESHRGEPDAVNAIEVVLVHPQHSSSNLVKLWGDLRSKGFEIYGDRLIQSEFPEIPQLPDQDWSRSSFRKRVAFRRVENIEETIAIINTYSSGHADGIVTESYSASQQFIQQVRSTAIYLNAAPQFQRCRAPEGDIVLGTTGRSGFGAIRMQSLLTPKRVVYGNAESVS